MAKVVFMGSPDFALPTLHALNQQYKVVGVVTQPDRASGRGRALTEFGQLTVTTLHRLLILTP